MTSILPLKRSLIYLFSVAFFSCFLIILSISFVYPLVFRHETMWITPAITAFTLLFFACIVLLFFIASYRWLRCQDKRTVIRISAMFFLIMVIFEAVLIISFRTILPPVIDGGHTYAEALYLLTHGHASGSIYFKIYPNNIPVTLLRYFLYSLFGSMRISSFMLIDRFFCALILDLGIYISWKLVQRFFDSQTACFFLLIAITCLPLYLYTMYFYTDTAVIAFPVLMLYLWYLYARNGKQRYMILLGLTLGVGVLIRPNLILFLPALAIYMFFTLKWRKVLLNLALIGLLMIVLSTGAQQIERHFGYQHDPALNMPTLHWIMLGLSHDGGYNHRDYRLTRLQTTPMLKKKADRQQIAKRIQAYGIRGLIRIWGIKAARTYGVGAHGYYWYTHSSAHPTEAYQYLFNRKNQVTIYIIQIFYVVHLILLLLSVLRSFRIKAADLNLLIQICLLGNFVFYVFVWEAEPRYSLLFTPFILLGALFGFKELELRISTCSIWNKHGALSRQRLQAAVVITLLTAVSLGGLAGMYAVTEAHSPQRYYIVDQRYKVGKGGIQVDARHSVAQTFQATGPFNRISFGVLKNRRHAKYRFVLSEARSGHALFAKTFAPRYRQPVQTFRIAHGGIKGKKQITITQLHGNKGASLTLAINGSGYEQRDLYPGGFLSQNGILKERKDLQFAVYRIAKGAYLSKTAYGLLLALPVMMLLWYAYVSLVMNQHEIKANSLEMNKTEKSTD